MDHCDHRVLAIGNCTHGHRGDFGISPGLSGVGAHAGELADIGTGGKGLFAFAAQHHATQAGISRQFAHDVAQVLPHGQVQGVHFSRIAEGDNGKGVLPFDKDGGLHGCSAIFGVVNEPGDAAAS
ncbi:hypothetical protein D3C76_1316300 [compost metagenome]